MDESVVGKDQKNVDGLTTIDHLKRQKIVTEVSPARMQGKLDISDPKLSAITTPQDLQLKQQDSNLISLRKMSPKHRH